MDLKVELDFIEAKESKYRKNAALQIRQEVENVLKHVKLSNGEESAPEAEEVSKEKTKKASGDKRMKNQMRRNLLTRSSRKARRATSAAVSDSGETVIRMLFTAEISTENRSLWRVLPVRWVR